MSWLLQVAASAVVEVFSLTCWWEFSTAEVVRGTTVKKKEKDALVLRFLGVRSACDSGHKEESSWWKIL